VIQQGDSSASRRLSDVSRAHPGDVTLQNLLGVVVAKLDSCRRLPIFAFEAANEGHPACAQAFRDLARAERESMDELLAHLARYLAERDHQRNGIRPTVMEQHDLDPEEAR
jgi:rubrerythrin